jgi:hypothetical protein
MRWLIFFAVACGSSRAPDPAPLPLAKWRVPAEWKEEVIPFPLDFAPTLAHQGVEELRFAPGFFKPGTPGYWSYAFTWRTTNAAKLDAATLAGELTEYFKGLITAVDEQKKQVKDTGAIVATATDVGKGRFTLAAHVFDAFGDGRAVDLIGFARRQSCDGGALWVFVLAPSGSPMKPELDKLAGEAVCGQPVK